MVAGPHRTAAFSDLFFTPAPCYNFSQGKHYCRQTMQQLSRIRQFSRYKEPAAETLGRIEPLLVRIQACPPRDISFTDDLGVPVHITYRVCDLQAVAFNRLKEWGHQDFLYRHSGKGLTAVQSKVSCIMEAIERYSASYVPLEGRTCVAAFKDLGPEAIDPRDFFLPRGVAFDESQPLTWFSGTNLFDCRQVLVPVDYVLMDIPDPAYPFDGFETRRLGFYVSNGLCTGPTLDHALSGALCEVVERDFQSRITAGAGPLPVELDLRHDADFADWFNLFEDRGMDLRAFYSRHSCGIVSVAAASWDHHCRTLVTATGADPDPALALQSAILEVARQRAFMFFHE